MGVFLCSFFLCPFRCFIFMCLRVHLYVVHVFYLMGIVPIMKYLLYHNNESNLFNTVEIEKLEYNLDFV